MRAGSGRNGGRIRAVSPARAARRAKLDSTDPSAPSAADTAATVPASLRSSPWRVEHEAVDEVFAGNGPGHQDTGPGTAG
ncbi:MAG: hypothetical protein M3Y33_13420 [Actinomycetota bacterium]|nr:hypothetical protein [Actinomycetota bacterium]